jgi:hypothetical protein
MQKMCLAQTGVSIDKKGIISIAGRLAYSNTTGVSKPVARPNYKIIESIIRMEFEAGLVAPIAAIGLYAGVNTEFQCDKMAGYLLGRASETALAIIL